MKDQITLFDTSIATNNVGDEIIMDAVNVEVNQVFSKSRICRVASHDKIGIGALSLIRNSDFAIVGGSNILSSEMNKYKQWKLDLMDVYFIPSNVLLLGVGWRQYQQKTNFYTRKILKKILCSDLIHSVRDNYTKDKLIEIGIENVINTGCPTMWNLTPEHCSVIPLEKAKKVLFTLTDYSKDVLRDKFFIEQLLKNYESLWYWPQGRLDLQYLIELGYRSQINIVSPNLNAYNSFLNTNDCDYIGTRLHGGIRALQKKHRTIILGIDNRAMEKKADFNLPVLDRLKIEEIDGMINRPLKMDIKLPSRDIDRWKFQFIKEV